jgi:hypothetical protein
MHQKPAKNLCDKNLPKTFATLGANQRQKPPTKTQQKTQTKTSQSCTGTRIP